MYSTSLTYTLKALSKNIIAKETIYCIKAINGKNTKCHDIPQPENITKTKIIIHDIRKLIRPLVTIDIGNISLGKYTFLIKLALFVIQVVPCKTTLVNQVQGIMPQIKNMR